MRSMTTSLKTWSNFLNLEEPLSEADKSYFRSRTKRRVHSVILSKFHEVATSGSTKAKIADRLGVHPSLVTRWLASPGNVRLETVSDLLLAMGAELTVSSRDLASIGQGNYRHPVSERTNSIETNRPPARTSSSSGSNDPVVDFRLSIQSRPTPSQTQNASE